MAFLPASGPWASRWLSLVLLARQNRCSGAKFPVPAGLTVTPGDGSSGGAAVLPDTIAPRPLGGIERRIRPSDELREAVAGARLGEAEARRDLPVVGQGAKTRLADRRPQPLGEYGSPFGIASRQQQNEFLAAEAGAEIASPRRP